MDTGLDGLTAGSTGWQNSGEAEGTLHPGATGAELRLSNLHLVHLGRGGGRGKGGGAGYFRAHSLLVSFRLFFQGPRKRNGHGSKTNGTFRTYFSGYWDVPWLTDLGFDPWSNPEVASGFGLRASGLIPFIGFRWLGPANGARSFTMSFLGEGFPTKIDYRKNNWYPYSSLPTGGPRKFIPVFNDCDCHSSQLI